MNRRIEAVVFDLDGVLVDSEPVHHRALRAFLAPDVITDEQYAALVGTTTEHTLQWVRDTFRRSEALDELARLSSDFVYRGIEASPLVALDGASGLIDAVRARGRLVAVASQSSPRWVEAALRAAGLAERIPMVITASEVRAGKPAPDIYLHAAERLGLAPSACVAIEDSVPGIRSASAAGMVVVQLRQATHVAPPQSEADAVLDSLRDFPLAWLDD